MKVTKVEIRLASVDRSKTRLRAFASVVIDDCLKINNIRVIEDKDKRLFISLPSVEQKVKCSSCSKKILPTDKYCSFCGASHVQNFAEQKFKNLVQFITPAISDEVKEKVVKGYKKQVNDI